MNKKGDLLHHSIIYKVLSSLLYLIAYPILFILTNSFTNSINLSVFHASFGSSDFPKPGISK